MKLEDVKEGDTLIADEGFHCLAAGPHVVLAETELYVQCAEGKHFLSGQLKCFGELVGFTKAP